mmetsp:Transcript_51451/g.115557  ORF Transcript_51451/g.115557 Transcript_51451/m.115557 type:complete len:327 (-) Transcript_51451:464-1444(-)
MQALKEPGSESAQGCGAYVPSIIPRGSLSGSGWPLSPALPRRNCATFLTRRRNTRIAMTFADLPEELLAVVLSFLPAREMARAAPTCSSVSACLDEASLARAEHLSGRIAQTTLAALTRRGHPTTPRLRRIHKLEEELELLPSLLTLLNHRVTVDGSRTGQWVRWHAIAHIMRLDPALIEPNARELLRRVSDVHSAVRQKALEAVRGFLHVEDVPTVMQALTAGQGISGARGVRRAALKALGELPSAYVSDEQTMTITASLYDADESVRVEAFDTLCKLGVFADPASETGLLRLVHEEEGDMRLAHEEEGERMGREIAESPIEWAN